MTTPHRPMARTLRALAALLGYPNAELRAHLGEISQALADEAALSRVEDPDDTHRPDGRTAVIDSPGFQEFGLHHIAPTDLARLMPDIARHTDQCRFYNCTHRQEPGCGVQAAVQRGDITPTRISLYTSLFDELSQTRW